MTLWHNEYHECRAEEWEMSHLFAASGRLENTNRTPVPEIPSKLYPLGDHEEGWSPML